MAPTPALSGMLPQLPNLGATITGTWTKRCYGQDRRNEASRHAAEESGSGLVAPLQMAVVRPLHLLCFGHCAYGAMRQLIQRAVMGLQKTGRGRGMGSNLPYACAGACGVRVCMWVFS